MSFLEFDVHYFCKTPWLSEIPKNPTFFAFNDNPVLIQCQCWIQIFTLGKPPKQIFGKSWDFGPTSLTPPPPLPERWDFFREFFGNFRQKRVKYAIKTVICKSWDWVRPPPPLLLGPNCSDLCLKNSDL